VRPLTLVVAGLALTACSASTSSRPAEPATTVSSSSSPVRLIFLGDVMLGRGVGVVAAADPGSIFEQLRPAFVGADLVLANLESPLTSRPHTAPGFALEADPVVAPLLASAGIDVVDLANNHATDAGPDTVLETISATTAAGLRTVGAGADEAAAAAPVVVHVGRLRVGVVAFDLAGGVAARVATAGVNPWDPAAAKRAVTDLRAAADVVIVGLHGGVEYLPHADPVLQRVVDQVASWGADVVWGHGSHVPYPVTTTGGERPAVVAAGLGNALFDQNQPGTDSGTALEVLADQSGALAWRTGRLSIAAGRSSFAGWDDPTGDAVALRKEWWTPVRMVTQQPTNGCASVNRDTVLTGLPARSTVVSSDCGSVTGRSDRETVLAYRRPASDEVLHAAFPGHRWADAGGRSAHLAVIGPDGTMRWGAATLLDPIGSVAVCSGALAVGFTTLDDPTVIAAGAWTWSGFGFRTTPTLARPLSIGCADVDHDGSTEPLIRRASTTLWATTT
jgi:poly-gamma-glutamate capsule biosynthesis protein CapA/YwtB (metallophosphatase superfamily)